MPGELPETEYDETLQLTEAELLLRFQQAVAMNLEIARLRGKPIAVYDSSLKTAYLRYPNGEREYC